MLTFAVHLLHHVRGPAIDYVGVGLAAFASWVGVPGPGEPLLIAAGIYAAKHKLDVSPVLLVAWAGATAGGMVGWVVGLKAGRTVLTAPGPLREMRLSAVTRGEAAFKRVQVIAILLTPSWVAGINRASVRVYLPTNAAGAALWAAAIGLGSFYGGPIVVDLVDDAGVLGLVLLGVLVVSVVGLEVARRVRVRARRREASGSRAGS